MSETDAVHQAQLRDMPLEAIIAFLRSQGHGDVADVLTRRAAGEHVPLIRYGGTRIRPSFTIDEDDDYGETVRERAIRFAQLLNRDRLPFGYPPRADDDLTEEEIPFDAERDL